MDGWWMDGHQFSPPPPEDFCRGITLAGNWCILWLAFMEPNDLAYPKASFLRRNLFRTREVPGSKKQPFAQGVIVNPWEVSTTPWYICQPAVRRSIGILTFSPSMKRTTRHTTFKFICPWKKHAIWIYLILKSFLSRTIPWRVTLEVLCQGGPGVVCLFRKSTFMNEAAN